MRQTGGGCPSATLPGNFHSPAPLRRSGQLADSVEQNYIRSQTALLALYRVVALGCGISWLVFLAVGSHASAAYRAALTQLPRDASSLVFWLFTLASVAVIVAGAVHRHLFYRLTLALAGGSYVAVLAAHLGSVVLTGDSPLTRNYLGDYVGLPMGMLMAVIPGPAGLLLAMTTIAVAVVVNLGTPFGFNTVLEIAHGLILMLPFLLLLQAGRRASAALDELVANHHQDTVRLARLNTLSELETRFLGYVHDRVLSYLDGIGRDIIPLNRKPVNPRELLALATAESTLLPVTGVVSGMVTSAREVDPALTVTVPESVPAAATMPADVAASISDALLEAVSNAVRHAPDSDRSLEISLECDGGRCTGMTVQVTDGGRGFDPEQVPLSRAGLRVAITGRMEATPGCRSRLITAPGEGTRVVLDWSVDGPGAPELTAGNGDVSIPTPYDLVGVGQIFRPANAVVVMIVFLGLGLNNSHPVPPAYLLSLLAAVAAVWALVRGRRLKLPRNATMTVAAAVLVFLTAALVDDPPPAGHWPAVWYPWVFVLLCTYLAIRDRAAVAWSVWALGLLLVATLAPQGVSAPELVAMSVLLLPATLIPRMVELSTRGLGLAIAAERSRATELKVVAAKRAFLTESTGWVDRQLVAALAPAFDDATRRYNARLLELKLRDSIRSPLFDTTEVNRAVWDARAGGVRVRLLDDRSTSDVSRRRGADGEDPRLGRLHRMLVEALAGEEGPDSVTARIFPEGRAVYATVLVSRGEDTRRLLVS